MSELKRIEELIEANRERYRGSSPEWLEVMDEVYAHWRYEAAEADARAEDGFPPQSDGWKPHHHIPPQFTPRPPSLMQRIKRRIVLSLAAVMPSRRQGTAPVSATKVTRPVRRKIPLWHGLFPGFTPEERKSLDYLHAMPWNGAGQWSEMKDKLARRQDKMEEGK